MRKKLRQLALGAVMVALASTGVSVLTASPAAAATCYGGAVSFPSQNVVDGTVRQVPSSTGYYTTSSRCTDIQVDLTNGADLYWDVQLCWVSSGTCKQAQSVRANAGWVILATDVLDGTKFRLKFHGGFGFDAVVGGKVAS